VLLAVWAWAAQSGVMPRWFLPAPGAIAYEFVGNTTVLWKHTKITAVEAIGGCLLGSAAGIAAALAMSGSSVLREIFYPYALASRAMPLVVFTPIIVVMLGRGSMPIILIVGISTYFPVFLGMMRGLSQTNTERMELLHSFSATPQQIMWKIRFPSSIPYLFTALKLSASASFINTIVTEWIASNAGLGYLVMVSGQYFKLATMWAAIVIAAMMTLLLLAVITGLERLAVRYTSLATEI
jgi:NitT/TauT family transport system permease protein